MDTVFIIGIGGTGTGIVSKLKKKVNKIYNDPAKNPLGTYYHSFVIDTEPYEHQNLGIDRNEYFPATNFDGDDRVSKWSDPNRGIRDFINWWPDLKTVGYFKKGAGAYRSKGRLALLYHIREVEPSILNGIQEGIMEAKRVLATSAHGATVRVFIACSLCGGTGGGMFIDLAYWIKSELKANDFNPIIVGMFFLPGTMRGKTTDEIFLKWYSANSYAALLELNYWQNPEKGEKYRFIYSKDKPIEVEEKFVPYDYGIFIEGRNKKDRFLENFYEYEQLAADIIFDIGMRESSSLDAERVMDNIQSNFQDNPLNSNGLPKMFGSFGRGILRYPFKKFKKYLALRLYREIIREKIIKLPESRFITDDIDEDMKGTLKTWVDLPGRGSRDDLLDFLKSVWLDEIGLEHYFPSMPPISTKLGKITKKNFNKTLNDLEEALREIEKSIRVHSERKKNEKTGIIKGEFKNLVDDRTRKKGLGYLHAYFYQILNKINGKVSFYKENEKLKTKNLSQISDERLVALRNIRNLFSKRLGGKKDRRLRAYERTYIEYFNGLVERISLEFKIQFLSEFLNIVDNYIHGLDPLYKTLNETVIQDIENSLEQVLLGQDDIYAKSQLVIEVLENNLDFLEERYKKAKENQDFIIDNNMRLHLNLFVPILLGDEDRKGYFIRYLSGDTLKEFEREELKRELVKQGVELLEKSFEEILDISIWEALELEAKHEGKADSNEILSYMKEKASLLQDEAAQPFWKTSDIEGSFSQRLLIGDSKSLEIFQKKYPQLTIKSLFKEAEFIEFGANKSEIILCYGELGIPIYKQPLVESTYKDDFDEMKKQKLLWIDKRKNEKTLPTLAPTGLEVTTLFLLAEHLEIVIPTVDRIGKETGLYNFRNRNLQRGLKGRDKAIDWFQSPSSTRSAILKKLQTSWSKINPSERKKAFKDLASVLEKKSLNKKTSEYLRNIYENNWRVVIDAIDKGIYDREELVPKRYLAE